MTLSNKSIKGIQRSHLIHTNISSHLQENNPEKMINQPSYNSVLTSSREKKNIDKSTESALNQNASNSEFVIANDASTPLVSVIIPTYNNAPWLSLTLESVFNQTYRRFEIIVVNDGSTDKTLQVLAGYGEQIRVITQANAGLSAARNSGLRAARGEMIGFLDSDDLWYPEMLSATVSYLKKTPAIDLVCGAWDFIEETGHLVKPAGKPSRWQASVDADFLATIVLGNLFPVHAVLVRRSCFECCGFFDTSLKAMEDWDMWLRLAAHGHRVGFIDLPVARYRRHDGCMSREPQRMEIALNQVLGKLFSNEQNTGRLQDLQVHAYLFTQLYLAQYCQEAGLDPDLRRYLQKAEDLYLKVPCNIGLNLRYFHLVANLPYTDHFLMMMNSSDPGIQPDYLWLATKRSFMSKSYPHALVVLFKLLVSQPRWVVRKFIQKIGIH